MRAHLQLLGDDAVLDADQSLEADVTDARLGEGEGWG